MEESQESQVSSVRLPQITRPLGHHRPRRGTGKKSKKNHKKKSQVDVCELFFEKERKKKKKEKEK